MEEVGIDAVGGGECHEVLLEGTTYGVGVGSIGTVDAVVEKLTGHAAEQCVASGCIGAYLAQQVVEWRVAIMFEACAEGRHIDQVVGFEHYELRGDGARSIVHLAIHATKLHALVGIGHGCPRFIIGTAVDSPQSHTALLATFSYDILIVLRAYHKSHALHILAGRVHRRQFHVWSPHPVEQRGWQVGVGEVCPCIAHDGHIVAEHIGHRSLVAPHHVPCTASEAVDRLQRIVLHSAHHLQSREEIGA